MTVPVILAVSQPASLVASCAFGGRLRGYDGQPNLSLAGSLAHELCVQRTLACVSDLANAKMGREQAAVYLVAGVIRPPILARWGPDPCVVHRVVPAMTGGFVEEDGSQLLPTTAKFDLRDAVERFQDGKYLLKQLDPRVFATTATCPGSP